MFTVHYNGTHKEVYGTEQEALERFAELFDAHEEHGIKHAAVAENGKVIYAWR